MSFTRKNVYLKRQSLIRGKMALKSNNPIVANINRNFLIRWKFQGIKGSNLVSAGKYHLIVGEELKNKHFAKVLEGMKQEYAFLIRKRLKINFISK